MNLKKIREDFPILGTDYCYLDNAATTQRPRQVIESVSDYYLKSNGSVAKGFYQQSVYATEIYEKARQIVADFINANSQEIVFCSNTTDGINLFTYSYGYFNLHQGDEIVVSITEHHSNFIPWQQLASCIGIKLRYLYCDHNGIISEGELDKINERTKIVAITYVSNVLGYKNPIKRIASRAHKNGAIVVVDGAQAIMHFPIDVREDVIDVLAFSGHKMLAPYGVGVLYINEKLHKYLQPVKTGGGMVEFASENENVFLPMPYYLESGTKNVAGIIGLVKAIQYIESIGWKEIIAYEKELISILVDKLKEIEKVHILGSEIADEHTGIVSLVVKQWHVHDIASFLAEKNIAVRAGVHCAQPLHCFYGINASLRFSIAFYNTKEEIAASVDMLKCILKYKF